MLKGKVLYENRRKQKACSCHCRSLYCACRARGSRDRDHFVLEHADCKDGKPDDAGDRSAEPCTVLISGISYHYLFRNHADSFEANDPGGVFVNGSRIMDSLILPSDIDSDWMFWQDNTLWCDAAGEQLIVLLHRDADGAFAETGTPVLVIAPAETEQAAQALLQSLRETRAGDAETQRLIEPFLK